MRMALDRPPGEAFPFCPLGTGSPERDQRQQSLRLLLATDESVYDTTLIIKVPSV